MKLIYLATLDQSITRFTLFQYSRRKYIITWMSRNRLVQTDNGAISQSGYYTYYMRYGLEEIKRMVEHNHNKITFYTGVVASYMPLKRVI